MGRNDEIRNRLESLAEPEFQRFASSLIPDLKPGFLLGVRLPKLRKISREIAGNDPQGYLK
ncbi:MAG: DNA alkylation repair protein, partial [[Clostridium] leptum]